MFTEITGTVRSIGIIYTKLMRDDWSMMYIPNNVLTQSIIQNLSRVSERLLRVRLEVSRDTDIDLFKKMLNSRLSKDKLEKEKLSGLDVKISLMSTNENLGIIITAHVKILDYERLSQFLSENAIKALMDVQKRGGKRK
jgi:small conductance mechanosensitive channel